MKKNKLSSAMAFIILLGCSFGIAWFLGSWLLGALYDNSIILMIALSVFAQILSIPFYWLSDNRQKKEVAEN